MSFASLSGSNCAVFIHRGNASEDERFYCRVDQSCGSRTMWQYLPIITGQYIADISVRYALDAPISLQDPCLSVLVASRDGTWNRFSSGWCVPNHYGGDLCDLKSLGHGSSGRITRMHINDWTTSDRKLRVDVQSQDRYGSGSMSPVIHEPEEHLPTPGLIDLGLPMRDQQ